MDIREPESSEDFDRYYDLRWRILRQPWNRPRGSEKDDMEGASVHLMACIDGNIAGVGRLHFNTKEEAQIRYMAVDEQYRRNGIGTALIKELERRAADGGARYIVLNARENAVDFYIKNGYKVVEKSYVLFESINHFKMRKLLNR